MFDFIIYVLAVVGIIGICDVLFYGGMIGTSVAGYVRKFIIWANKFIGV